MKFIVLLSFCIGASLAIPPPAETPLSSANNQFAVSIYKELLKFNKGNFIFSPFSAQTILALTSEGAKGDTKTELLSALHLPESSENIRKCFNKLLPQLKVDNPDAKLLTANKIYANIDVQLENDFKKAAVDVYESGAENIDFSDGTAAARTINEWVQQQTHDKIKNLIKEENLNVDTGLVLVNSLYFSAKWLKAFKDCDTAEEDFFTTANETVKKTTMSQMAHFNYYEHKELNAQYLELPYDLKGMSMMIVLPNGVEGLKAVEDNMTKVMETHPWSVEYVDLKLPKFTVHTEVDFVDILKSLGVKKIFDSATADLTGFSSSRKDLYVSDVVQKAFVDVSEAGTEAAASTAVLIESRSERLLPMPTKTFYANHPFLYFIKYYDVILFAGKYNS